MDLSWLGSDVWDQVGNAINVVTLITLVLSIYSAWTLFRQSRRLREQAKALTRPANFKALQSAFDAVGTAPVALAFSLTPDSGSIEPMIERYLTVRGWKMPIKPIDFEGITPENIENLIHAVRLRRREIETEGFTDVHIFYSGPVTAALLIGSLLDNWLPVKLYHKLRDGTYEYWTPLL